MSEPRGAATFPEKLKSKLEVPGASAAARGRLAAVGRGRTRVVVGPWISEVGFELLYWIPMLRRLASRHAIDPARMVALTRGGAGGWYGDFCESQIDLYELFSASELQERQHARTRAQGGQKHVSMTGLDREIMARAEDRLGTGYRLLHPSAMYRRFRPVWMHRRPTSVVFKEMDFRPLRQPDPSPQVAGLPRPYVAVKAYFTSCMPDREDTREFFSQLLERLTRHTNVVLLSSGLDLTEHGEHAGIASERLYQARDLSTPADNLAVQTQIVSGASALLTTCGGYAYLGPMLGVPTLGFYAVDNINPVHLEVLRQATRVLGSAGAQLVPLDIDSLDLIERLAGWASVQ